MKAEKKGIVIISAVIAIAVVTTIILIPLLRHNSVSGYMKEDIKNVDNISLISRCSEIGGKKNSVAGVKESVRLGKDMERDGFLKPQRIAETIKTLKMFRKLCDAYGIERIIAVATAAVRRAKNQRSFWTRLRRLAE